MTNFERQTFTIADPTANWSITAYNSWGPITNSQTDPLFEKVDNWDNSTNKTLTTAPKGIGHGTYLISTTVEDREVALTLQLRGDDAYLRQQLRAIKSSMLADNLVNLTRTYLDAVTGTAIQTETLSGYIKGQTWDRNANDAVTVLTIKCLNPDIQVTATDATPNTMGML